MFMWLKKPFKSIFDMFPAMKFWNSILGLASFTTVKREDGVKMHFADKGDQINPAGVTVCGILGSLMIFVGRLYPSDTKLDDTAFKLINLYICFSGHISRHILSFRIETFLRAFHLIDEIDQQLRTRNISIDYEESRRATRMAHLASLLCFVTLYPLIHQSYIAKEDIIYNVMYTSMSSGLGGYTVSIANFYLIVIASTIERRFRILTEYLGELATHKNERMIVQELQMIAILHMKLCQSWKCGASSLGAALICLTGIFWIFCLFPLPLFGFALPRLKNEAIPALCLLLPFILKLLYQLEGLKQSEEHMKDSLINLSLERGKPITVVNKMCTTLLLQMEHVKINLIFGGFFPFDFQSFLVGIKSCSTFMMFLLQLENLT